MILSYFRNAFLDQAGGAVTALDQLHPSLGPALQPGDRFGSLAIA